MIKFYLTTNIGNQEPEAVRRASYVHVKSYQGQTVIIAAEVINDPKVIELSREQAQRKINEWLADENSLVNRKTFWSTIKSWLGFTWTPETPDDQLPNIQAPLPLEVFFDEA